MTSRKWALTIGLVLVAGLVTAVLLSTASSVEPADPAKQPVDPAGPQPEGDPILLEVLGEDSVRISGQDVHTTDLVRHLTFLADGDRDEGTWNRVSRRELVVRAAADLRWGTVRRFLLLAADPAVRIYRVFLALPGGAPVAISVSPHWVAALQGDWRRRGHIGVSVCAELHRNPGDEHTQLELLGEDLGTGPAAFATLRKQCATILASPGAEGYSADLMANGRVAFGEVVEILSTFWSVGHEAVFLDCLMPPGGMWPIGKSGRLSIFSGRPGGRAEATRPACRFPSPGSSSGTGRPLPRS